MSLDRRLVALLRPASWETERYRMLRRSLEKSFPPDRHSVIAVSSANAGEGKSTTSVNLAAVLAEVPGSSVILVDADFRCGSVATLLGCDLAGADLGDAIKDESLSLADVTREGPPLARFGIVPARPDPAVAHLLVQSPRFAELLAEARQAHHFVIVDTPPLLPVSDCRAIGHWVDGFVVVVAANRTPRDRLGEALDLLEPNKLLGLVLNGDDEPGWKGPSHYYAHYGRPH